MTIIVPFPPDLGGGGSAPTKELRIRRKLTRAFILTRPISVVLVPRERTKKPGGGWVYQDKSPRQAQTMRLIEITTLGASQPLQGSDGVTRQVDFTLLGNWDAVIGLYDHFELNGKEWEVASLVFDNGYEQRASVIKYG